MTREEALDVLDLVLNTGCEDAETCRKLEQAIEALSSADAIQVVRCKDCKWHLNGHLCKQLSQYGSIETPPSFYCGFGERREP